MKITTIRRNISSEIGAHQPFGKEFLRVFAEYELESIEAAVGALTKLRANYGSRSRKISSYEKTLATVVRNVVCLGVVTKNVSPERAETISSKIEKINTKYDKSQSGQLIQRNRDRFETSYKNLHSVFLSELFPLVLKYLKISPDDFDHIKRDFEKGSDQRKFYDFLVIHCI